MISLTDERLTELERSTRRRFRLALLGYILLAVGGVVGFALQLATITAVRDNQRDGLELVRRGQIFDCRERARLEGDQSANCATIGRAYDRVLSDLED